MFRRRIINDTKNDVIQSNQNTSPTKTTSSSTRRQIPSRRDSINKESEVRKLSRQSTISPLKDEDYFTEDCKKYFHDYYIFPADKRLLSIMFDTTTFVFNKFIGICHTSDTKNF